MAFNVFSPSPYANPLEFKRWQNQINEAIKDISEIDPETGEPGETSAGGENETVETESIKTVTDEHGTTVTTKEKTVTTIHRSMFGISSYNHWNMGPYKAICVQAPENLKTAQEIDTWGKQVAQAYQKIGLTQEFTSPIRPYLLVGDAAKLNRQSGDEVIGLITSVRHSYSKKDGFKTVFSTDTGGVYKTNDGGYIVYATGVSVDGGNRVQNLADAIRIVAGR